MPLDASPTIPSVVFTAIWALVVEPIFARITELNSTVDLLATAQAAPDRRIPA
jgi:hypothetical protein